MAKDKDKEEKKAVFDVSKPGSTPASSSGKPVIVSHKPMIKDPMVNDDRKDVSDPEMESSDVAAEEEMKAPSEKQGGKVLEPISNDMVGDNSKVSKTDEEESEDSEQEETSDDKEAADVKVTDSDSNEEALVGAVVSQAEDKKKKVKDAEDAEARQAKIKKLIDEKKYFVKVRQPKAKRNKRTLVVGLIVILLAVAGVGLAADAELIDLPVPFDFIKNSQPADDQSSSENEQSVIASEQNKDSSKEEYVIPEGFVVYENPDYGFKFAYPKEWGEVSFIDEYKNNYQYTLLFSSNDEVYGLFEKGPTTEIQQGKPVPIYTTPEAFQKNVIDNPTILPDGSLAKYELINVMTDKYTYGFCYYDLGISLVAKVGSNENSLKITKSPNGKKSIDTQTAVIPACVSDESLLKDQIDKNGNDTEVFDKILDTIKAT
ncbi:hypothetical protein KDA00_04505 [Candidatus Saccharibacteria bacterium]|nr:hypothetical protein [Candidatus Saccharibacteria bacterium]